MTLSPRTAFVLRHGVRWALFMFVFMTAWDLWDKGADYVLRFSLPIGLVLWPLAGLAQGLIMWRFRTSGDAPQPRFRSPYL